MGIEPYQNISITTNIVHNLCVLIQVQFKHKSAVGLRGKFAVGEPLGSLSLKI